MPESITANELEQLRSAIDTLETDIDDLALEMKIKERLLETKAVRVVKGRDGTVPRVEIQGTGANAVLQVGGNVEINGDLRIESPDKLVQLQELSAGVADALADDTAFHTHSAVKGDRGPEGPKGKTGPDGDQGERGEGGGKGETGQKGDTGPSGRLVCR